MVVAVAQTGGAFSAPTLGGTPTSMGVPSDIWQQHPGPVPGIHAMSNLIRKKVAQGQVAPSGNGGAGGPALGSIQNLMPNAGWFNRLDPNIMSGITEPYMDAHQRLMEQMNLQGQLGGGAGMSPAAAAFSGEFGAEMGKGIGLQAWNMISPIQQIPYSMLTGLVGQGMPTPVVQPQTGGIGGGIAGAGMGALAGYQATGNPWGAAAGGLAGLFGGIR
jgi:hypothetical protein